MVQPERSLVAVQASTAKRVRGPLDETLAFLAAARKDPRHTAFVLAITMGPGCGERTGCSRGRQVVSDRCR